MCYNAIVGSVEVVLRKETQDYVYNAYQKTLEFLNRKTRYLLRPEFGEYSSMYTFTTENIDGYLRKIDVSGKDILTVTASGDHLINMALRGAKSIDNFDVNRNTYFMAELKIAALEALGYEEFLTFFTDSEKRRRDYAGIVAVQRKVDENPHFFEYKIYLKIRPFLKEEVALYWDLLYEEYEFSGLKMEEKGLFLGGDKEGAINSNSYLKNEQEYAKARSAIQQVERRYYFSDILQIHQLPATYDVIFLSNIYDYVTDDWHGVMTEEAFHDYVANGLKPILNPDAQVAAAYQYHYRVKNAAYKPSLKNLFRGRYTIDRRESLEKFGYKKVLIPSVVQEYRKENGKDCFYVYEGGKTR